MKTIDIQITSEDNQDINAKGIIEVNSGKIKSIELMGAGNVEITEILTTSQTFAELQQGLSRYVENMYSARNNPKIKFEIYER